MFDVKDTWLLNLRIVLPPKVFTSVLDIRPRIWAAEDLRKGLCNLVIIIQFNREINV